MITTTGMPPATHGKASFNAAYVWMISAVAAMGGLLFSFGALASLGAKKREPFVAASQAQTILPVTPMAPPIARWWTFHGTTRAPTPNGPASACRAARRGRAGRGSSGAPRAAWNRWAAAGMPSGAVWRNNRYPHVNMGLNVGRWRRWPAEQGYNASYGGLF